MSRKFLVDIDTPFVVSDKGMKLTGSPGANHSYSGLVVVMTAGENLVMGEVVYLKSDGKLWKSDADTDTTMPVIAMSLGTVLADDTGDFILQGVVRDDSWDWTAGGMLYAGTDGGTLTQTPPSGSGDMVQCVGVALSADVVYFNPNYAMVEVS
ncbi:MAG TPA: hypothetical protein P5531_04065 [Bacteroidales bacterium]|nr:hypothetical protein [Bacteroidales bacterium]